MILRVNHKSSHSVLNSYALGKAISKDIDQEWAFIITIESLQSIKNAGVVPLGVAEQWSIKEKREQYIKRRATHDCSFPGPSGLLVKTGSNESHPNHDFMVFACSGFYTWSLQCQGYGKQNESLFEKQTWTQPTARYTQTGQPCWHALKYLTS